MLRLEHSARIPGTKDWTEGTYFTQLILIACPRLDLYDWLYISHNVSNLGVPSCIKALISC
jgi:hypothetical protein